MAYITEVTHPNELAAKKVGFFADYFYFAANTLGQNDFVTIENPLSLVDKILIQLEQNFHYAPNYIQSYFSNEWFLGNTEFWDSFPTHVEVMQMRLEYLKMPSEKTQRKWLKNNFDAFSTSLKLLQTELRANMFDVALAEVVSYTKCDHEIDHHKTAFISGINCMVTEFILNGHSKNDVGKLFDKILSKDDTLFPFPADIDT